MSIEILDRGTCKVAGTFTHREAPADNAWSGLGLSAIESVDAETIRCTMVEPIAESEFLPVLGGGVLEGEFASLEGMFVTWETDTTFLVHSLIGSSSDWGSSIFDLAIFRIDGRATQVSPAIAPSEWELNADVGDTDLDDVWAMAYSPLLDRVVAMGDPGGAYSDDKGATWLPCTAPAVVWNDIFWSPERSLYMAVTDDLVCTSPDGITFTTVNTDVGAWYSVIYAMGLWLRCNYETGSVVATSADDGVTWIPRTVPVGQYSTLAASPDAIMVSGFVDAPPFPEIAARSVNGIVWTEQDTQIGTFGEALVWASPYFVLAPYNNSVTAYRAARGNFAGVDWGRVGRLQFDFYYRAFANPDGSAVLAIGVAGVDDGAPMLSLNHGARWNALSGGPSNLWFAGCWAGDRFLIGGQGSSLVSNVIEL